MKKYVGIVKIKGHFIQTALFADSELHAKLLFQYHYGWDCLLNNPKLVEQINQPDPKNPYPSVMMPPKATLKKPISLKQQKQMVQQKKMNALVQQQANIELKQQSKVTQADVIAAQIKLGDIKRLNKP